MDLYFKIHISVNKQKLIKYTITGTISSIIAPFIFGTFVFLTVFYFCVQKIIESYFYLDMNFTLYH